MNLARKVLGPVFGEAFFPQQRALPEFALLYAVQVGTDGPIKIGRTVNMPRRFRELRTACPYPLRFLGHVMETPERNEATEHARLADRRLESEWFDVTPADLPWLEEA